VEAHPSGGRHRSVHHPVHDQWARRAITADQVGT